MILSPGSLAGGWESLDGSPDFYIFRDSSGDYRLLAYSLDAGVRAGKFLALQDRRGRGGMPYPYRYERVPVHVGGMPPYPPCHGVGPIYEKLKK